MRWCRGIVGGHEIGPLGKYRCEMLSSELVQGIIQLKRGTNKERGVDTTTGRIEVVTQTKV